MGHEFTASLDLAQEEFMPGDEAAVDVKVTDELGNRIVVTQIYTEDPDALMDASVRLQEEDGEFALVTYDEQKQEFQPIAKQDVRPRLVLKKDGKTVAETKAAENWKQALLQLPNDLKAGTYSLIWTAKLPFELEAEGTLTVGEKEEAQEEAQEGTEETVE